MKRNIHTISIILIMILITSMLAGCQSTVERKGLGNDWEPIKRAELLYAKGFEIDYYQDGYKLITVKDDSRFLLIPEGMEKPEKISKDIICLYSPLKNIYLAATSAMCLFDSLDKLDTISLSGTREDNWHIENAKLAMREGRIKYAGKYSEPDYEMLLEHKCPMAIESLMISHASEVKKKLEELGIPVFTDCSSLESHPLGRTEWIKLYGALLDEDEKAKILFDEQVKYLNEALKGEDTNKTVAFFHISSSGYVVARKSGDYVSEMIKLAGGQYVFDNLGDPETKTSTVTIEMEKFFATAKEADYIIYNSTIGGEIKTLEELIKKNKLLAEFKAVKNNNVWCTSENMYQETTKLGEMIQSFQKIFSGQADNLEKLPYLFRLK